MNLIHTSRGNIELTPALLLKLHGIIQAGSGDAGQWKQVENEIIETRFGQAPVIRFKPVSVKETPAAVEELCRSYRHAIDQERVPPLLAVGTFVFDFLCIHPFRDGNGRAARLLTLLSLYQHGIEVGRYISLERLIEESKEDYYRVLKESSEGWHSGKHDILPWFNYFLSIVRRAYKEFEARAGQIKVSRGGKTALVHAAIQGFLGNFTLSELERACPGVSRDMVRQVLKTLQKEGKIKCLGKGPGAAWQKR
ncbi:MAG: Fic family protein [Elusimicrobia bacterium]|nr:Fic family protein [Elusimicrobiota bacterium]